MRDAFNVAHGFEGRLRPERHRDSNGKLERGGSAMGAVVTRAAGPSDDIYDTSGCDWARRDGGSDGKFHRARGKRR